MNVVCCHVPGQLRKETLDALHQHAWTRLHVDLIELPAGDELAYRDVLAHLWREGRGFMVVEPDIVIRADVIDALFDCGCDYGCFPYAWLTDVGPALGCTWFKQAFVLKYPGVFAEMGRVSWRQLDVVLMRHILARRYGEQPHVHVPAVQHLNPDKQLMEGRPSEPLMSIPHW